MSLLRAHGREHKLLTAKSMFKFDKLNDEEFYQEIKRGMKFISAQLWTGLYSTINQSFRTV
jgi:hypothetical protein